MSNGLKNRIMQMASGNPDVDRAVAAIEAGLRNKPIVPEDLDKAIQMLEHVLQHPETYQEVRQAAIADGLIDERMIPIQYNQAFVVSMLIVLYRLQDRAAMHMAKGGLAQAARRVAAAGRGGDTELAHVNPREAEMLRRMGGSGTINPHTGLREYKGGFLGSVLSVVVPVVTSLVVPGIGSVIGGALESAGIGAATAGVLGSAATGAGLSAALGGNPLTGAVLGGIKGGMGDLIGKTVDEKLGLGLGSTGQALLGSGLAGAAAGAATGKGVEQGLQQGVLGGAIGQLAGAAGTGSALGQGITSAGKTAGTLITAGAPKQLAGLAGIASGLVSGLKYKPSDSALQQLQNANDQGTGTSIYGPTSPVEMTNEGNLVPSSRPAATFAGETSPVYTDATGNLVPGTSNQQTGLTLDSNAQPASQPSVASTDSGLTGKLILGGLLAAGALSSAPQPVQQAVSTLSPQQQAYFNRPSVTWDWNRLQTDANSSGLGLSQYMARNWNKITAGDYNVVNKAAGGPLSQIQGYAQGSGSGRADTIEARLSDGEYVVDAETVSLLGDGSNKEGARKLDEMRSEVRKQKGKKLAKGKISPNAKSPLTYIKERVS